MTIAADLTKRIYTGNDVTTVFSYPFQIFTSSDLTVIVRDNSVSPPTETQLVEGSDYSVTGVGDENGGSITYPLAGTPLEPTETITLWRKPAVVQETDLQNQGGFHALTIEQALDKLTMIDQYIKEFVQRAMTLSVTDESGASLEIPGPEAGKILGWNSLADALENLDLGSVALAVPGSESILASMINTAGAQAIYDKLLANLANDWMSRVSAADNEWRSIVYGNGLFVAVATTGTGNRIMTSEDGVNWTARTSPADNDWRGLAYGDGRFVAVASSGTGNRVMTSEDGITWTLRTSAADLGWRDVVYGNGLFVAVALTGTGNRVMTSPDGITWTSRTSAADNDWHSIDYGNGIFVAVAETGTGNRVMTSPDGITWTIRTSAADNDWHSVAFGNGLFVAVAITGSGNRVMTSADGITWTIRTSAADNEWRDVSYVNGLFVAVATTGTGNRVMTSTDGITWSTRNSAADNGWYSIAYGNGIFVAVAITGTGDRVMTSGQQVINIIEHGLPSAGLQPYLRRSNLIINGQGIVAQRPDYTLVKDAYDFGACDRFEGMATGTLVSAGTLTQATAASVGITGFAHKFSGVTLTGTGILYHRTRIESRDAKHFKNLLASFGTKVYHDVGSAIDYTITVRKADVEDDFSATTEIGNSGAISVNSAEATNIEYAAVAMGDCSNGIEIEVKIECGAITTKNFELSDYVAVKGSEVVDVEPVSYETEFLKCARFFERWDFDNIANEIIASGFSYTTARSEFPIRYLEKRKIPVVTTSAFGTFTVFDEGGFNPVTSSIAIDLKGTRSCRLLVNFSTTPVVAGQGCWLGRDGTDATYIEMDAEF